MGERPAKALNAGIIYLAAAPLLIFGYIGYRWWKSKEAVMLEAFLARVKPALAPPLEGSPLERLHQSVVRGAEWLHSKDSQVAVRLISDVQEDPVASATLPRTFLSAATSNEFRPSPTGHRGRRIAPEYRRRPAH